MSQKYTNCRYCDRSLRTTYEQTVGECLVCSNEILRQQMAKIVEYANQLQSEIGSDKTPGGLILEASQESTEAKINRLESQLKVLTQFVNNLAHYSTVVTLQVSVIWHQLLTSIDNVEATDQMFEPFRQQLEGVLNQLEQKKKEDLDGQPDTNMEIINAEIIPDDTGELKA